MRPYVHLSADERLRIYQLYREGLSQAEIARHLGRDKGTIRRELSRNEAPAGYRPDLAQRRYQARCQRSRPRPHVAERALPRTVILLLQQGWSPKQISGRLRLEHGGTAVNHETIYRFVYDSALGRQKKLYQLPVPGEDEAQAAPRPPGAIQARCPAQLQRGYAAGGRPAHPDGPLGDRFTASPRTSRRSMCWSTAEPCHPAVPPWKARPPETPARSWSSACLPSLAEA